MITEDYVSLETAKLLKEKGFAEKCMTYFKVFSKDRIAAIYHSSENRGVSEDDPNEILCPTIQMAMKWLREVHNLYIQVMLDSWACGGHMGYYVVIQKTDSDFEIMLQDYVDNVFYQTYEEACEAAINYCLENLI